MEETTKLLATHDAEIKALERRIESCEENSKAITQLAESVAKMTVTLKNTDDSVKELKSDIADLKSIPKTRLDTIITAIITAIIGGVLGYLINIFF